ncbi:protein RALF-like 28 [Raphanus sativus]|uniref:Protein RALF-like 28 n=1 Tax=Raphanus sativus TaxID=3726 RepID=A0A6J0NTD1_RAPSA|nr:protein RALF-like 28 [Raphanus sativus]
MSNLKGTSRIMVVAILMAACVFMNSSIAAGRFIGYPPIRRGDSPPGCDPKYPGTCKPPQPVNPYKPGCGGRCRRPPLPRTINI